MVKKFYETESGKGLIGRVLRFRWWRLRQALPAVSGSAAVHFSLIWPLRDLESNFKWVGENSTFFSDRGGSSAIIAGCQSPSPAIGPFSLVRVGQVRLGFPCNAMFIYSSCIDMGQSFASTWSEESRLIVVCLGRLRG